MKYANGKFIKEQWPREIIEEARKELNISKEFFSEVGKLQWKSILTKISETFVIQRCSAKRNDIHWCWDGALKYEASGMRFVNDDGYKYLHLFVESNEPVWFLAEGKYHNKYWVYQGYIEYIKSIILNSAGWYEYYIVSKKYEWLLGENHHSFVFGSGEYMVNKIEEVRNILGKDVIYK